MDAIEASLRLVAQVIEDIGSIIEDFLGFSIFAIENSQRIAGQAILGVGIQVGFVRGEVVYKGFAVGSAIGFVADAIEVKFEVGEADGADEVGGNGDRFYIGTGIGTTEEFETELVELALASGLGAFVAEHASGVPETLKAADGLEVIFDVGADGSSGAFGAEGEGAIAFVIEGVHFFANHVCGFADASDEEVSGFDQGGADFFDSGAGEDLAGGGFDVLPVFDFGGQDVAGAFGCLDRGHDGCPYGVGG